MEFLASEEDECNSDWDGTRIIHSFVGSRLLNRFDR